MLKVHSTNKAQHAIDSLKHYLLPLWSANSPSGGRYKPASYLLSFYCLRRLIARHATSRRITLHYFFLCTNLSITLHISSCFISAPTSSGPEDRRFSVFVLIHRRTGCFSTRKGHDIIAWRGHSQLSQDEKESLFISATCTLYLTTPSLVLQPDCFFRLQREITLIWGKTGEPGTQYERIDCH